MSRRWHGRKRRTQIDGQFAARLIEMLESPPYRVLSLSARRVLDRLEIELARHGGMDNGRLPVTFDDFEAYGMDRHAIAPAIQELVALGFVEVTERGRAGNAEWRKPNLFRLTYQPTKDADRTHDWRRVPTVEKAAAIARAARNQSAKKQKPVGVNNPHGGQNPHPGPVLKTTTTAHGAKPTLLSISRGGDLGRLSNTKRIRPRLNPPNAATPSNPKRVRPRLNRTIAEEQKLRAKPGEIRRGGSIKPAVIRQPIPSSSKEAERTRKTRKPYCHEKVFAPPDGWDTGLRGLSHTTLNRQRGLPGGKFGPASKGRRLSRAKRKAVEAKMREDGLL